MVDIGEGYVRIYDKNGNEIVGWIEDEWTEDPEAVESIAMALKIYYEDGEAALIAIIYENGGRYIHDNN